MKTPEKESKLYQSHGNKSSRHLEQQKLPMKQAGSEEPGIEATPAGLPTPQMGNPSTALRAPSTKHNKNTGTVLGEETQEENCASVAASLRTQRARRLV